MLKHTLREVQHNFYATPDDLLPVFERVEDRHQVRYVLTGVFETSNPPSYSHGVQLATLRAPVTSPSAIACPQYLVVAGGAEVSVRPVSHAAGTAYAIDQLNNPDSITLSHGGFFAPGILLSGRVGTASHAEASVRLYRAFANAIANSFKRVKAFYVGPQAFEHFKSGCRLTISANSPPDLDLVE